MSNEPKIPTGESLSSKDLISLDDPDALNPQGENNQLNLAPGPNSAQNAANVQVQAQAQNQDQNDQDQNQNVKLQPTNLGQPKVNLIELSQTFSASAGQSAPQVQTYGFVQQVPNASVNVGQTISKQIQQQSEISASHLHQINAQEFSQTQNALTQSGEKKKNISIAAFIKSKSPKQNVENPQQMTAQSSNIKLQEPAASERVNQENQQTLFEIPCSPYAYQNDQYPNFSDAQKEKRKASAAKLPHSSLRADRTGLPCYEKMLGSNNDDEEGEYEQSEFSSKQDSIDVEKENYSSSGDNVDIELSSNQRQASENQRIESKKNNELPVQDVQEKQIVGENPVPGQHENAQKKLLTQINEQDQEEEIEEVSDGYGEETINAEESKIENSSIPQFVQQSNEQRPDIFTNEDFVEAYEKKAKLLKEKDVYRRNHKTLLEKLNEKMNSEFNQLIQVGSHRQTELKKALENKKNIQEWEKKEIALNRQMENVNKGQQDPHSNKWTLTLNGRFPSAARRQIDVFVRDYKYQIKELLELSKNKLADSKKASAEKKRVQEQQLLPGQPTPEEKEVEFYQDLLDLARRNEHIDNAINKDPDLRNRLPQESQRIIFGSPEFELHSSYRRAQLNIQGSKWHQNTKFEGPDNSPVLREKMISQWENLATKFFKRKKLLEEIQEMRKEKIEAEKKRLEAEQHQDRDEEDKSFVLQKEPENQNKILRLKIEAPDNKKASSNKEEKKNEEQLQVAQAQTGEQANLIQISDQQIQISPPQQNRGQPTSTITIPPPPLQSIINATPEKNQKKKVQSNISGTKIFEKEKRKDKGSSLVDLNEGELNIDNCYHDNFNEDKKAFSVKKVQQYQRLTENIQNIQDRVNNHPVHSVQNQNQANNPKATNRKQGNNQMNTEIDSNQQILSPSDNSIPILGQNFRSKFNALNQTIDQTIDQTIQEQVDQFQDNQDSNRKSKQKRSQSDYEAMKKNVQDVITKNFYKTKEEDPEFRLQQERYRQRFLNKLDKQIQIKEKENKKNQKENEYRAKNGLLPQYLENEGRPGLLEKNRKRSSQSDGNLLELRQDIQNGNFKKYEKIKQKKDNNEYLRPKKQIEQSPNVSKNSNQNQNQIKIKTASNNRQQESKDNQNQKDEANQIPNNQNSGPSKDKFLQQKARELYNASHNITEATSIQSESRRLQQVISRQRSNRATGGFFVNLRRGNNVIRIQRTHLIASSNYGATHDVNFIMYYAVPDSRISQGGRLQGWTNVLTLFLSLPYNRGGLLSYFRNAFNHINNVNDLIAGGELSKNKLSLKLSFPNEFSKLLKDKNLKLRCFLIAAKFIQPISEQRIFKKPALKNDLRYHNRPGRDNLQKKIQECNLNNEDYEAIGNGNGNGNGQQSPTERTKEMKKKNIAQALDDLSIDPDVCIWSFGDDRRDPNPHFSADANDMRILSTRDFRDEWIFESQYNQVDYEGLDLDLSDEFPAMAIVEQVDNFKKVSKNNKLSLRNVSYRELKLKDADAENNIDYREDENPASINDIEQGIKKIIKDQKQQQKDMQNGRFIKTVAPRIYDKSPNFLAGQVLEDENEFDEGDIAQDFSTVVKKDNEADESIRGDRSFYARFNQQSLQSQREMLRGLTDEQIPYMDANKIWKIMGRNPYVNKDPELLIKQKKQNPRETKYSERQKSINEANQRKTESRQTYRSGGGSNYTQNRMSTVMQPQKIFNPDHQIEIPQGQIQSYSGSAARQGNDFRLGSISQTGVNSPIPTALNKQGSNTNNKLQFFSTPNQNALNRIQSCSENKNRTSQQQQEFFNDSKNFKKYPKRELKAMQKEKEVRLLHRRDDSQLSKRTNLLVDPIKDAKDEARKAFWKNLGEAVHGTIQDTMRKESDDDEDFDLQNLLIKDMQKRFEKNLNKQTSKIADPKLGLFQFKQGKCDYGGFIIHLDSKDKKGRPKFYIRQFISQDFLMRYTEDVQDENEEGDEDEEGEDDQDEGDDENYSSLEEQKFQTIIDQRNKKLKQKGPTQGNKKSYQQSSSNEKKNKNQGKIVQQLGQTGKAPKNQKQNTEELNLIIDGNNGGGNSGSRKKQKKVYGGKGYQGQAAVESESDDGEDNIVLSSNNESMDGEGDPISSSDQGNVNENDAEGGASENLEDIDLKNEQVKEQSLADLLKLEVKNGDKGEEGEEDLQKADVDDIVQANLIEQEQKEIRGELKKLNQLAAKEQKEKELEIKKLEKYIREKKTPKRDKDGQRDDQDEQEGY